jgi:hypothetical protein
VRHLRPALTRHPQSAVLAAAVQLVAAAVFLGEGPPARSRAARAGKVGEDGLHGERILHDGLGVVLDARK